MSNGHRTTPVEYRSILESEGYLFGGDGSVWSRWGKGYNTPTGPLRRLKATRKKMGHLDLRVKWDGKAKMLGVHVLIATAFHGPCPEGMECLHIDGNPANNVPSNLRWGTRQENIDDQRRHGVYAIGSRHGFAKLTDDDVREIRRLRAETGMTMRALGDKFGIKDCTVNCILKRKTWKHVA